jgi:predicted acetyltransferase
MPIATEHFEIRPASADEMPEVQRQAARQLGVSPALFQGLDAAWTLCGFVDGRVVTTYGWWPLQIRFNGPAIPVAGVTWVSTHPAYRRRGYLRAITKRHFEAMHEAREVSVAALHPAWATLYQRYGYGTVNMRHAYRIEPRNVVFAHSRPIGGRLREIDPDIDFPVLVDVYRRFREHRSGLVHRGRAMWAGGALQTPPAGHQRVVLVYEDGGERLGYAVFHHGPGLERSAAGPAQYLRITDLFALTPDALQALWGALASYDNVGEIRWDQAPADDPLVNMIAEPRLLNVTRRDGIMARLVTIEDALPLRPYAATVELRFRLIDPLCPWNDGRWRLDAAPEGATMTRTDSADVDLVTTPDVLASMAFGRISATDATRAGLLELRDDTALARWDAAMRTQFAPYEAEHTW